MTETTNRKQLHENAMAYAQEAMLTEQGGERQKASLLYRKAYLLEKEVAMSFFFDESKQPTRSVLFRSAAELAKNCGEYQDAQKLVSYGLSGNPPVEISDQLLKLDKELQRLIDNASTNKPKPRRPAMVVAVTNEYAPKNTLVDFEKSEGKAKQRKRARKYKRTLGSVKPLAGAGPKRAFHKYGLSGPGRVPRKPGQLLAAANQHIQRTGILKVTDISRQTIQIESRSGSITQIKMPATSVQSIGAYEGAMVVVKAKKQGRSFVFSGVKLVTTTH